jgi:chemotaxis protein MotB
MERAIIMGKKTLFSLLCLLCIILSACVPKEKFVELENQHSSTQAQLAAEQKQLADLQARYKRLQNTNMSLLNTLEDLKFELRQEKSAVIEKELAITELELVRRKIEDSLNEELEIKETELAEKEEIISELDETRKEIEASLKDQIAQKDIQIEEIEGKLQVTFVNRILFASGSVKIKAKGEEVLQKLAESFRDNQNQNIVVEGHTDDVQIGKALQNRFPTNWELSTARASAVVRFLYQKGKIEPERLTASGFSYFQPVASNLTEEGRNQNRRIEIILVPQR